MEPILSKLNEFMDNFPIKDKETTSLLLQVPPENSLEMQLILIKNLTDRGYKFVILSGGRPYRDLINLFEVKKIDLKNIHIIDMITKQNSSKIKDQEHVTYINGMSDLIKISILISQKIIPKKSVLFIDSVTSMLLYNNEEIFTKFINDTLKKMRSRGIHLIILITKGKNYDNLRDELKYTCDQQKIF